MQLLSRDELSGPLQKHLQDLKRLAWQTQTYALLFELLRLQVCDERAKGNKGLWLLIYRHTEILVGEGITDRTFSAGCKSFFSC
jgi:hypothetical protein